MPKMWVNINCGRNRGIIPACSGHHRTVILGPGPILDQNGLKCLILETLVYQIIHLFLAFEKGIQIILKLLPNWIISELLFHISFSFQIAHFFQFLLILAYNRYFIFYMVPGGNIVFDPLIFVLRFRYIISEQAPAIFQLFLIVVESKIGQNFLSKLCFFQNFVQMLQIQSFCIFWRRFPQTWLGQYRFGIIWYFPFLPNIQISPGDGVPPRCRLPSDFLFNHVNGNNIIFDRFLIFQPIIKVASSGPIVLLPAILAPSLRERIHRSAIIVHGLAVLFLLIFDWVQKEIYAQWSSLLGFQPLVLAHGVYQRWRIIFVQWVKWIYRPSVWWNLLFLFGEIQLLHLLLYYGLQILDMLFHFHFRRVPITMLQVFHRLGWRCETHLLVLRRRPIAALIQSFRQPK